MLAEKPVRELLTLYNEILQELRRRNVTRSTNNPVADLSEFLVKNALQIRLVRKSTKGYDAIDSEGRRYEIKGRRLTKENPSRQLSVIRELEHGYFTHLIGVLFRENFEILRACIVPIEIVRNHSKRYRHVNGWRFELNDAIFDCDGVIEITQQLRKVLTNL